MATDELDDEYQSRPQLARRGSIIAAERKQEEEHHETVGTRIFNIKSGHAKLFAEHSDNNPGKGGGNGETDFIPNHIKTSKYTNLTFVPLNLIEQLRKPTNQYFCFIMLLQLYKPVSITQGTPTIGVPLVCVLLISAVKDYIEDFKRKKADRLENEKECSVLEVVNGQRKWNITQSQNLQVGDIIRVRDGERFPADSMLIGTKPPEGRPHRDFCYVETSNIDGETNLKLKQVHQAFHEMGNLDSDSGFDNLQNLDCSIHADRPNADLEEWLGVFDSTQEKHDGAPNFGLNNLLLRGSELRNSGVIYGIIVYTGFESKIFMNNRARSMRKMKSSSVEDMMRKMILGMIVLQILTCLTMAINDGIWMGQNQNVWYIEFKNDPATDAVYKFFTWFIVFAQFIPISLLVSLELMRFGQMLFMQWDRKMQKIMCKDELRGWEVKPCNVQNSKLNEELGLIEFIFSDKTGTLTENSLDFRKCVVNGEAFGTGTTEIGRAAKRRQGQNVKTEVINPEFCWPHVFFDEREKLCKYINPEAKDGMEFGVTQYLRCLALNNDCFPVKEKNYDLTFKPTEELNFIVKESFKVEITHSECRVRDNSFLVGINGEDIKVNMTPEEINNRLIALQEDEENACFFNFRRVLSTPEFRSSSPDNEALVHFAHVLGVSLKQRQPPYAYLNIEYRLNGKRVVKEEKWEQLALLDFASHKKRMSIIYKNVDTQEIYAFIKGADSELAENIFNDFDSQPHKRETAATLDVYAEEGLRTLLVGYAKLTDEFWYDDWLPEWENAEMELRPNTIERFDFETKLDRACDYTLVGATAIEDKLQPLVPETIKVLLAANIRIWILTGDKLETAKNVGVACDLIDPELEEVGYLFTIDALDNENNVQWGVCRQQIKDAAGKMKELINLCIKGDANEDSLTEDEAREYRDKRQYNGRASMVLTSDAFRQICEHEANEPDILDKFLDLALSVKAVVACRLQPNQKSLIVKLIQSRKRVSCMAVGDGANDEPMIRTANVGVGIAGLEGTAAVRASDYAIAQFRFLRRLILVHGRNCYRRNSEMTFYILYKNCVACLTYLWFGCFSGFSGQPLYLEWAYQLYNVGYTAFPIYAYALLDKDVEDEDLEENPHLYSLTNGSYKKQNPLLRKNTEDMTFYERATEFTSGDQFTFASFVKWITEAMFTSATIVWFSYASFHNMTSADRSGQSFGLWFFGLSAYTSVVFVVNLRCFFVFQSWTSMHFFTIGISVIGYFFSIWVFSVNTDLWVTAGGDYNGMWDRIFKTERFWLVCLLTSVFSFLIISVLISWSRLFSHDNMLSQKLNQLRETRRQKQMFKHLEYEKKEKKT